MGVWLRVSEVLCGSLRRLAGPTYPHEERLVDSPSCRSDLMNPVSCHDLDESIWWMRLRCGSCGYVREVEASNEQARRLDADPDRGLVAIAAAVAELDRPDLLTPSNPPALNISRRASAPAHHAPRSRLVAPRHSRAARPRGGSAGDGSRARGRVAHPRHANSDRADTRLHRIVTGSLTETAAHLSARQASHGDVEQRFVDLAAVSSDAVAICGAARIAARHAARVKPPR